MTTLKKFPDELKEALMDKHPEAWQTILAYEQIVIERVRLQRLGYQRERMQKMRIERPEAYKEVLYKAKLNKDGVPYYQALKNKVRELEQAISK